MIKKELYESKMSNEDSGKPWVTISKTGWQIVPQQLAIYLKEVLPLKITDKGKYYLFDGKIYNHLTERALKSIIKDCLPPEIRSERDWLAVFKEFETDNPDVSEAEFDSDENIIVFENGVLHLDTMELHEFSDKYLITRLVPCRYIPGKSLKDAPTFYQYISRLVSGNTADMSFLLEYIGAILSNVRGYRFKKMVMLVGAGNTGKSQLREFVINLIGENNNCSIDLRKLHERFGTSQLYGKRLAGSGDMSNMEISELNIAKELTGGDEINAEFKGKDSFTFKYRGFLWFNANDLPYFRGDRGNHVYERFCIIRCSNVIPEEERDPHLLEKLLKEKDVIASVAVAFFKKAIERDFKFTESESMQVERSQYKLINNSLLTFVSTCCSYNNITAKHPNYIRRSEFYPIYKNWCIANSVKPEREREISKQLQEAFGIEAYKTNGIYYYPLIIYSEVCEAYYPVNHRNF